MEFGDCVDHAPLQLDRRGTPTRTPTTLKVFASASKGSIHATRQGLLDICRHPIDHIQAPAKTHSAVALTGHSTDTHDHTTAGKAVVKAARLAAIKAAVDYASEVDVYVVHPRPSPVSLARYRRLDAELVVIDPGRAVVEARCKADRPWQTGIAVSAWYDGAGLYRQCRNVAAEASPGSRAW